MLDGFFEQDRGAGAFDAVDHFPFRAFKFELGVLAGEFGFHVEGVRVSGPEFGQRLKHLGNNVAGLVDDDGVAYAHIKAGDFVLVVEAGVLHRGAGDHNRIKGGDGGGGAGAADRDHNIFYDGGGFFGRVFVSHGASRSLADNAESCKDGAVINLDHAAVSVKRQSGALLLPGVDKIHERIERIKDGGVLVGGETQP